MNINLELYKVFYYVCQSMSITEAAKNLYVSQPAITKQIKHLESCLGKVLFVRSRKGIELSDDGKKLYDTIKEPIQTLLSIENEIYQYPPVVRIIAGYSTIKNFLIKVISHYNQLHPEVKFEIASYAYPEAIERLKSGKADLIFINVKDREHDNFEELKLKHFLEVQDIFVASKDFFGTNPVPSSLEELSRYPIICKAGKSVSRSFLEESFQEKGLTFSPKFELSNNWLIEEYIRLNLGIGLVTKEFIQTELRDGTFVPIPLDCDLPKRKIGYALRDSYAYNRFLEEFVNELKQYLSYYR